MANVQPNQYVLTDEDLTVTYTLLDPVNPTLTYTDGTQTRNFSGSEIRAMHTEIGKLVTVTTRLTVDTGSTSFSVLIPTVLLPDGQDQTFETVGIQTVHKTGLVIPSSGAREIYEIYEMDGTAQAVKAGASQGARA
jgi:hypothetical protein